MLGSETFGFCSEKIKYVVVKLGVRISKKVLLHSMVENADMLYTAAFAERQDAGWCFGCTPAQLAAQGPRAHWKCIHHGQDASDADRANRVVGSAGRTAGEGARPGPASSGRVSPAPRQSRRRRPGRRWASSRLC